MFLSEKRLILKIESNCSDRHYLHKNKKALGKAIQMELGLKNQQQINENWNSNAPSVNPLTNS